MKTSPFRPNAGRHAVAKATTAMGLLLAAVLVLLAAAPGQASAVEKQAEYSFTLGYGKSGKALKQAGVRFSAVKPATEKRLSGKRVRIAANYKADRKQGEVVVLGGGIKFSKGKRKVVFRKPSVALLSDPMEVRSTVGGKTFKLFTSKVKTDVEPAIAKVTYRNSVLKLSKRAAGVIKSKLRIKRLPAGKIGGLSGDLQEPFEDPYLELCGLPATSLTAATVPEFVAPPTLADPVTTVGNAITWGFKASLNGYVNAIGSIQGLDGATVNRIPFTPPQVPPSGFTFAFEAGEYDGNAAGTADDQAVLNGSGSVMYCNQAHGFRVNIANPTVVIDGASSRIIADVFTNISGNLNPAQRVHLADLDLAMATIDDSVVGEVTWQDVPVTLSQTGSDALRLCEVSVPGAPAGCVYPAGIELDDLTVTADFAVG